MTTLPTVTFTADDLKRWRNFIFLTRKHADIADLQLDKAEVAIDTSEEIQAASISVRAIENMAAALMEDLGNANPKRKAALPKKHGTPLHLLDTPANRRLETALRDAYEAALAVDTERGLDEAEGLSGLIGIFLETVTQEIRGAAGARE